MNEQASPAKHFLTRRTVLKQTSLLLAGAAGAASNACTQMTGDRPQERAPLRIGLATDVHYADKPDAKTRHYRASLDKMSAAVSHFNELKTDLVIQLGDLIDAAESAEQETEWLDRILGVYAQTRCPRYHVLGNHCVHALTKQQFMARGGMSASFYSFDARGFHLVVLDACFCDDGQPYGKGNFKWTDANIPPTELEWLETDLKSARRPVVVFIHQRLDVDDAHGVRNRAEVRSVLETSGRVWAVLQGHNHRNELRQINGISYCTLAAMVEGDTNAYGLLALSPAGTVHIDGFGRQSHWQVVPFGGEGV